MRRGKNIGIIVIVTFLVLFGGLGACVKPYFTNTRDYEYTDQKTGITYWFGGTGSFVNEKDVMTNDHVVNNCNNIAVRTNQGIYAGKVIAKLKRKEGDVAFIRTSAKRKDFAVLSYDPPEIGDILIYPNYTSKAGVFDKVKGKVSLVNERDGFGLVFLSPKGRKGNSGSPVYNKKGYLVGVLHSGGGIFSNHAVAAPVGLVKDFAHKNKIKLYYNKNKDIDLSKREGFFEDFAVGILCDWKRS